MREEVVIRKQRTQSKPLYAALTLVDGHSMHAVAVTKDGELAFVGTEVLRDEKSGIRYAWQHNIYYGGKIDVIKVDQLKERDEHGNVDYELLDHVLVDTNMDTWRTSTVINPELMIPQSTCNIMHGDGRTTGIGVFPDGTLMFMSTHLDQSPCGSIDVHYQENRFPKLISDVKAREIVFGVQDCTTPVMMAMGMLALKELFNIILNEEKYPEDNVDYIR